VSRTAAPLMRAWYAPRATALSIALRPLSWVFGGIAALRRVAYRQGWLRRVRLDVPVIVVGNITVGGAGKTPLVAAIVDALRSRGFRPGIVSRGYGRAGRDVRSVVASDDARDTGDEPLILAEAGVPVWVGADRAATAQALLAAHPDVDVIVADDGLQHYGLARDVEIAVVDGERALGNRLLLPAGPLREPPSRLATVDAVVRLRTGGTPAHAAAGEFTMTQAPQPWRNLVDPELPFDVATLHDPATAAIAGIAHPERFFGALIAHGFAGRTHAFPDHHAYSRDDVAFAGAPAILMTQKDAVKCRAFADSRMWMLPIRAHVDPALIELVVEKLDGSQVARDAGMSGHEGTLDPRS
jgi:tetraacyldisaccharide 4'-kinase